MERALGFRAEAHKLYWAVVEGTNTSPILVAYDSAAAPVKISEASALSWYRDRVKHLVETYKPNIAMVRSAEPTARGTRREGPWLRSRIEGVLLQTIDSYGLKVSIGALATISGKLGAQAKDYLESGELRGLDLSKIPSYAKEAVLVAVAALP